MKHGILSNGNLLPLLGLLMLCPGCSSPAPPEHGLWPVDDRGTAPAMEAIPERLVILSPSLTEMSFALGAGDRIVGVSKYSRWPEEARLLPRVGGGLDPNPESVLRLKPDLVLSSGSQTPPTLVRLEELGIPVALLNHTSLDKVFSDILTLGKWLGREEAADQLHAQMLAERQALAHWVQSRKEPRPNVVILYGFNDLLSAGHGTFASDLVTLAGGINLPDSLGTPWPMLNDEMLLRWNPDLILFSLTGEESRATVEAGLQAFSRDPRWKDLQAVILQKLYPVDESLLAIPGPRSMQAAHLLAKRFYPEKEGAQ